MSQSNSVNPVIPSNNIFRISLRLGVSAVKSLKPMRFHHINKAAE